MVNSEDKPGDLGINAIPNQTRGLILRSAARQFRDLGYASTTLRNIASASNLEAGSVYHHFSSKAEILNEVLDSGLRDMYQAVCKTIGNLDDNTDYREKIGAAIHTHLTLLLVRSEYTSVIVRIYGQLPPEVRDRHRPLRQRYIEIWEDLLQRAQDAGAIRADIEIKPLRQFILGALNWTVEWYDENDYSVDILADRTATVILDGILTGKSAASSAQPAFPQRSLNVQEIGSSKSARTREKILKKAAVLFRKKGYKATTVGNIAAASGMKAGSIYYYFDTKTEILDEVLDRGLREMHDGVKESIESQKDNCDFRNVFLVAVHEHLSWLLVHSDFAWANLRTYSQLPDDVRKRHNILHKAYATLWDNLLAEARSEGILRDDLEIVPLRQFILGGLNWTVEWLNTENYNFDLLSERCAKLLLDGICTKS